MEEFTYMPNLMKPPASNRSKITYLHKKTLNSKLGEQTSNVQLYFKPDEISSKRSFDEYTHLKTHVKP